MEDKTPGAHHSAKWHSCWRQVQALGHDESAAAAICTAALGHDSWANGAAADLADDPAVLLDALETAVKRALAPVVARLGPLETAAAGLSGVQATIATLAGAAPVPGPPGPAGPSGADGAAGAGLEAVTCDYDGERTVTFRWTHGGATEEKAITFPVMLYRGVHIPGRLYERGDCVTTQGSIFHCHADTTSSPGSVSGAAAWTLAVKHGRDAR